MGLCRARPRLLIWNEKIKYEDLVAATEKELCSSFGIGGQTGYIGRGGHMSFKWVDRKGQAPKEVASPRLRVLAAYLGLVKRYVRLAVFLVRFCRSQGEVLFRST